MKRNVYHIYFQTRNNVQHMVHNKSQLFGILPSQETGHRSAVARNRRRNVHVPLGRNAV
jgi:hypothetical protein